jgi:hypothetical protein
LYLKWNANYAIDMQVVFLLNFTNPSLSDLIKPFPHYFLPMGDITLLEHNMNLFQEIEISKIYFVLPTNVFDTTKIQEKIDGIMSKKTYEYEYLFTDVIDHVDFKEDCLLENTPILTLDPSFLYKNIPWFLQESTGKDATFLNGKDVTSILYFKKKDCYIEFLQKNLDPIDIVEKDYTKVEWLLYKKRYFDYISLYYPNDSKRTRIEQNYTIQLTDTCKIHFQILKPKQGFQLEKHCIAILLEGTCQAISQEEKPFSITKKHIMIGEGMFLADSFCKILFIDDSSIQDTKDFCGILSIEECFPDGCIISSQPPSLINTNAYEVQLNTLNTTNITLVESISVSRSIFIMYHEGCMVNAYPFYNDSLYEVSKGNLLEIESADVEANYIRINVT